MAYVQDSAASIGGSDPLRPKRNEVSITAALVHVHSGPDDGTEKPDVAAVTPVMGPSGEPLNLGRPTKEPEAGPVKNLLRRVSAALEELGLIRTASTADAAASEARLLRRRASQRRIMTCFGMCAEG